MFDWKDQLTHLKTRMKVQFVLQAATIWKLCKNFFSHTVKTLMVIRIDNEKVKSGVKFTPDPTPSIKWRKVKLNLTYLRAIALR